MSNTKITNTDRNFLLWNMPCTESRLISKFVVRNNRGRDRSMNARLATFAKRVLYKMKEDGLCSFIETMSKSGIRVIKRTWSRKK